MASRSYFQFKAAFILWTFLYLPRLNQHNDSPPSLRTGLSSSLWCDKPRFGMRTCRFRNLYYNRALGFLFVLSKESVILGLEDYRDFHQLKLSPIADHPGVNLKLTMVDNSFLTGGIRFVDDTIFMLYRFKPDNFMHVIHDDLLPLFQKFKELCFGLVHNCLANYVLLFADSHPKGPFFQWYRALSSKQPIVIEDVEDKVTYCFSSVLSGVANTSFFQYGFRRPQGPVEVKLTGTDLKEFRNFYLQHFNVTSTRSITYSITLISRSINRKIVNEGDVWRILKSAVSRIHPGLPIRATKIDLILNRTSDVLHSVASSHILIGMHGAEALLSLFLPDKSVFLEMFPFAIAAEHVSPVYALCRAKGIHFAYIHWHNHREENSIVHPEYPQEFGGLGGYSDDLQRQIYRTKMIPPVECCNNPFYMFRMYQDTFVDESLLDATLLAIRTLKNSNATGSSAFTDWFFPGPVRHLNCERRSDHIFISWAAPINTHQAEFSLALLVGSEVIHLSTNATLVDMPIQETEAKIQVWVRSLEDTKESLDSYVQCT